MIDASAIAAIIETYQKHGWILRRVLLSPALKTNLGEDAEILFGDVPITDSVIDAAWFSRPPKNGGVAWEIRYLGDVPYALLSHADENTDEFETILQGVEERLRDYVATKETA
jgi:hypothetical protein